MRRLRPLPYHGLLSKPPSHRTGLVKSPSSGFWKIFEKSLTFLFGIVKHFQLSSHIVLFLFRLCKFSNKWFHMWDTLSCILSLFFFFPTNTMYFLSSLPSLTLERCPPCRGGRRSYRQVFLANVVEHGRATSVSEFFLSKKTKPLPKW